MKVNQTAATILEDALLYLDDIIPAQYQQEIDVLFSASIGQHTRHFVEFFQCLIDQVEGEGTVFNYSKRQRDQQIETDPVFAATCIRRIQEKLYSLEDENIYQLECSEHLPGDECLVVPTNLSRELMYNIEHTIHHLAIIKIGLQAIDQEMNLPEHFGVAPSTILHRNHSSCAQ
jgi:hypothetical protein